MLIHKATVEAERILLIMLLILNHLMEVLLQLSVSTINFLFFFPIPSLQQCLTKLECRIGNNFLPTTKKLLLISINGNNLIQLLV
uniref:Uncharacterized protein n=1 Tax=Solanum tuberosum TaxID=4113 RepID=M1C043_SOLTU